MLESEEIVEVEGRTRQGSLRDLYYVLFRHKRKSLLFLVVVVTVVSVGTFMATEIYESEAKLLVKPGRESLAVDPTVPQGRIISIGRQMEEQLNSELEILKSWILVEKVVDAIGPEKFLTRSGEELGTGPAGGTGHAKATSKLRSGVRTVKAVPGNVLRILGIGGVLKPREKAIQSVSKKLNVEVLKKSNVIQLTFESQSPELSKKTLEELIDFYLDHHLQVYQTGGSHSFFKEQTESLRAELIAAEEELRNFKNNAKVADLTEQRTVVIQRLGELQRQTQDVEAQLAASKATVSSLEETLTQTPQFIALEQVTGQPNYFMDNARFRLLELRLREKELLANYSEGSRLVQNVREQIQRAEAVLSGEKDTRTQHRTGINSSYQQLELALLQERGELAAVQKQREVLNEQVTATQTELRNLNNNEIKFAQLERHRTITEQNYRNYVDKLEETRISQALEREKISNIAVIQPATMPILPVKPKKTLNLLLGLFLGLFGAIGLSFMSEYMDHSIKTPEDVEESLQLPVLASIPRVSANGFLSIGKRRTRTKTSAIMRKKGRDSSSLSVHRAHVSQALEVWDVPAKMRPYFHHLRERLVLCRKGSKRTLRVLAITSCHRGEGVSTIAADLATTLARDVGGRVLLVDANIGSPSVHKIFKTELSPGLTDILTNSQSNEDIILSSLASNLDILPAGTMNGNIPETFFEVGFMEIVNSISSRYRFVVIDMPALSETSSAFRLASLCDGVVLVIEAEQLRWEVAQRAKEELVNSNANLLGAVINKRRFPIPAWLYRTL